MTSKIEFMFEPASEYVPIVVVLKVDSHTIAHWDVNDAKSIRVLSNGDVAIRGQSNTVYIWADEFPQRETIEKMLALVQRVE